MFCCIAFYQLQEYSALKNLNYRICTVYFPFLCTKNPQISANPLLFRINNNRILRYSLYLTILHRKWHVLTNIKLYLSKPNHMETPILNHRSLQILYLLETIILISYGTTIANKCTKTIPVIWLFSKSPSIRWMRISIWAVQNLPGLKPACSGIRYGSRLVYIICRISLSNSLNYWHKSDTGPCYLPPARKIWIFSWFKKYFGFPPDLRVCFLTLIE